MTRYVARKALFVALWLGGVSLAQAQIPTEPFEAQLTELQHTWARAYYQVPEKQKEPEFEVLAAQAQAFSEQYPEHAEPLVWQAIILSSYAKFQGGLGALDKIKRARSLLESAEQIDAEVLDGSIYTSLGSLYTKAPGWPLAFGDKKKAEGYLQKALALNPDGIDPNYFYGDLLLDMGKNAEAEKYLRKALMAPPRPGREDADAGRIEEINAALARLQS